MNPKLACCEDGCEVARLRKGVSVSLIISSRLTIYEYVSISIVNDMQRGIKPQLCSYATVAQRLKRLLSQSQMS